MGCGPSIPEKYSIRGKGRKRRSIIHEVAVFVPTIRIPVASDIAHPLRGIVSKDLVDRLSTLRAHVVALAEEICKFITDLWLLYYCSAHQQNLVVVKGSDLLF